MDIFDEIFEENKRIREELKQKLKKQSKFKKIDDIYFDPEEESDTKEQMYDIPIDILEDDEH